MNCLSPNIEKPMVALAFATVRLSMSSPETLMPPDQYVQSNTSLDYFTQHN